MINVAFDIDGVLTNIESFMLENGKKFFNGKYDVVNPNGYDIKEIFGCTENEENDFWKRYLLPYVIKYPARNGASELTRKLHEDGAKIHIITSRIFTDKDNKTGKLMRFIVKEWLKHNGIIYDNIEFCNESKVDAIKKYNIDVIYEDSPKNILELSNYTKVICMDASYNRKIESNRNIIRTNELNESYEVIKSLMDFYNKKIDDEIKPLANKASIDKPWKKYYTYGQYYKNRDSDTTIFDYMYSRNKKYPNQIALQYFGQKMTYKEFFRKVDQCADSYIKMGIKEGDIVTICMPNTPEAIISFYALNKIGAVSNMIHPLKSETEIKEYINQVKSKMVLCIDIDYDKINNIIDQTNVENVVIASAKDSMPFATKLLYSIGLKKSNNFYKTKKRDSRYITWKDFMKKGSYKNTLPEIKYDKDKTAVIMRTGGTTGIPKGVKLTNKNFNSMVNQFSAIADNFKRGDKMLTVMPVFHGFGLCSSIHLPLSFGITSIPVPQLSSKILRKIMKKYKPNNIIGVPTLWRKLRDDKVISKLNLSNIKYAVSGGDDLKDEPSINEFLKRQGSEVTICKGYGLSEAVAGVTFSYNGCNPERSVGIPMVNTNIKIVYQGSTDEVNYNEIGEICISGDTVMNGYYENEEETLAALKKHKDGKVWLHTGDLGKMTEDGILYYVDRSKRMFISSGVNVYSSEIEKVLTTIDEIKNCAVIPIPDQYKGQVAKAFLQLKEGIVLDEELKSKINDVCSKNLDKYHWPKEYEEIDNFPVTDIGKIDYKSLEEKQSNKVIIKK